MNWSWSDPYLPAAGHSWANLADPYRICDVLWAVPFFPGTGPLSERRLWIVERFSPWHYAWAKGFSWRLKDWAFAKKPYFWRILSAKLASEPEKFNYLTEDTQLALSLTETGFLAISYLYFEIDETGPIFPYSLFANHFLIPDTEGITAQIPELTVYPDITCVDDFRYQIFYGHSDPIYLRKKVRLFRLFTEKEINLANEKEKIIPGSVVVSSDNHYLKVQAEKKLGFYLYANLNYILADIDDFVPQLEVENAFASQSVFLSEIGHIRGGPGGYINTLLGGYGGDPWLPFRWALVFSIEQLYNSADEDYLPLIPYGLSNAARGSGEHKYICLHLQFNSGTLQSWHSPDEEKLAQLLIKPESLNNGMLETLFHSIPGKVQQTGVVNGATYVWTRWSQYPNYDLAGFLEVRADIEPFFFIEWINSLRKLINIMPPGGVFSIRSIALADAFNVDEFFAFRGGAPDIIVDPIYHYNDPAWINHPCNPNNQTSCYAKTPNAAASSELLDWEQIGAQYPDLAPVMQSAFSVAGDLDIPRIYYPAINNLWNAQEEPISNDNRPYRIEWIRRYPTGWILHDNGSPYSGKEIQLEAPNLSQWVKYNFSYWDYDQNKLIIHEDIKPLAFTKDNIEAFLYRKRSESAFWQGQFDQGYITYDQLDLEKSQRKLGMAIDSPRIIEIHWALSAQKFAYLDDESQAPDRVATLGYYIERIARVLGISVNPDGSIRSIRQKAVIERGEPIPEGWNFGQWGENEGNATPSTLVYNQPQQGGGVGTRRDGIVYENRCNQFITDPFSGQKTAIKQGDFVLCENWPQYFDQLLDDLDQAIDWQELGAFAIPGADTTERTLFTEGLAQMLGEALYMASAIHKNTSQTQISSLITQGVAIEILKAFGQAMETKIVQVDTGDERPLVLPYPGLQTQAPSVLEQIGWVLQNLSLVVGAIVKPADLPTDEIQPQGGEEE